MARHVCPVCTHPDDKIRQLFNEGKSVSYVCSKAVPTLIPSDIEFHSRHSPRKVTLADSATAVDSSDVHDTIHSRREEMKKKLDRVSKLLDRELDSPTSQKGLKDAAQEFRMMVQALNEIDAELAAQSKAESKATGDGQFILPQGTLENAGGNPTLEHHFLTEGELISDERGKGRGRTLDFQDFDALLRIRVTLEAGKLLANVTDRDPSRQTQKRLGHAVANLGRDYPFPPDFDPELIQKHASLTMAEIADRKHLMADVVEPEGYQEYKNRGN